MDSTELIQLIEREPDINIFDVFAALYLYCEPRCNAIRRQLRNTTKFLETKDQQSVFAQTLESLIPSLPPKALLTLDSTIRQILVSKLFVNDEDLHNLDLRCFALLRAIDEKYANMIARSRGTGNLTAVPQMLNRTGRLGQVYPKQPSPMFKFFKPNFRTGREEGNYIRDDLYNLVVVQMQHGYRLDFGVLDSPTWLCFPDLPECKVALIPLINQMEQVKIELLDRDKENKQPWRAVGLKEADKVVADTMAILQQLSDRGVTVAVFPELCVPEIVRTAISKGLKANRFPQVKLVIAGSFHELEGTQCYNVSYVLGPDGKQLWQQKKFEPYTLMPWEAKNSRSLSKFAKVTSYEDITTGRILVVRDTPLGRMAVLICSDLLRDDPYRQLLFDLNVNFIVVPAMSATVDPDFPQEAEKFAIRTQATTVVSNSCAMAGGVAHGEEQVKVSFAFRPSHPPIWWCRCSTPLCPCNTHECSERFILQFSSWPQGFERS